jgi:hypothetical protein
VRLSEDHKPDRRDERARIVKAGGLVTQVSGVWRCVCVCVSVCVCVREGGFGRQCNAQGERGRGSRVTRDAANERERRARVWLAVSRALGDLGLKEPSPLVVCTPEVRAIQSSSPSESLLLRFAIFTSLYAGQIRTERIGEEDLFMVLACDGVFDVMADQEVIDVASEFCTDADAVRASPLPHPRLASRVRVRVRAQPRLTLQNTPSCVWEGGVATAWVAVGLLVSLSTRT